MIEQDGRVGFRLKQALDHSPTVSSWCVDDLDELLHCAYRGFTHANTNVRGPMSIE